MLSVDDAVGIVVGGDFHPSPVLKLYARRLDKIRFTPACLQIYRQMWHWSNTSLRNGLGSSRSLLSSADCDTARQPHSGRYSRSCSSRSVGSLISSPGRSTRTKGVGIRDTPGTAVCICIAELLQPDKGSPRSDDPCASSRADRSRSCSYPRRCPCHRSSSRAGGRT